MKAIMRKRWGKLVAEDEDAQDLLVKIPDGREVSVNITQSRNPQQSRLYWKLMHTVSDNTDEFVDRYHLHDYVMQKLEKGTWYHNPDGSKSFRPQSIAHESMDQTEFQALWNQVLDLIVAEIIPGLDRADLEAEVWDLVGYNYGEQK